MSARQAFRTADEMVQSVVKPGESYSVAACKVSVSKTGFDFTPAFFIIPAFVLFSVIPIDSDVMLAVIYALLIGPFIIFKALKWLQGVRSGPDAIVLQGTEMYLLAGVERDKRDGTFSYGAVFQAPIRSLQEQSTRWLLGFGFAVRFKSEYIPTRSFTLKSGKKTEAETYYVNNRIPLGDIDAEMFA